MRNKTIHQLIWKREGSEHSDLSLRFPKPITSDVGFQLQFGVSEDARVNKERLDRHHERCATDTKTLSISNIKEIKWI